MTPETTRFHNNITVTQCQRLKRVVNVVKPPRLCLQQSLWLSSRKRAQISSLLAMLAS